MITRDVLSKTAARVLVSLLMAMLLSLYLPAWSDQAQYFYDELGRLVGVVDGAGNVAVYQYDPVGNLLGIQRYSPGSSGVGIFLLAPSAALVGANVQLQGFGFSPTLSANQVAVNGTAATVASATATILVITLPAGATSGPVTVTNSNGTATSPQPFTVLVPPIIAGLAPNAVAQGTITQVVLAGFNLDTVTAVTFTQSGLSAGLLQGGTATSLPLAVTVSTAVPAGTYPFSVTSPAGTAQSGAVTLRVAPPIPVFGVTTLSVFVPFPPAAGPTGPGFSQADVSVFLPFPSPGGPQGPSMGVAPPVSVSTP